MPWLKLGDHQLIHFWPIRENKEFSFKRGMISLDFPVVGKYYEKVIPNFTKFSYFKNDSSLES